MFINRRQSYVELLTRWGRVTHICVCKLTIFGSDNGLSPGRRQTIIWTNARILLIGPLGTKFSEISIKIQIFLFMKMHLRMSSVNWQTFCHGLNVLNHRDGVTSIYIKKQIYHWLTHWDRDKMAASHRHFHMHFIEWNCMNFDWDFTKVCS